jgi:hypothetical protein
MSCGNYCRVGFIVPTLLLSCGGQASSGAAGGDAPGSGGITNHVPAVETKGPLAQNRAICDDYLRIWRVRLKELAPGMYAGGVSSGCNYCLNMQLSGCNDGLPAQCGPSFNCIDSHCLCPMAPPISDAVCAEEPRDDLCACVAACLPIPAAPCDAFWIGHFKCMADACRIFCGGS